MNNVIMKLNDQGSRLILSTGRSFATDFLKSTQFGQFY